MAKIGKTNELEIAREVDFGFYLKDDEGNEILLPQKYATEDMKIGDKISVFVYKDSEDRPVATTEKPKAEVGQFAFLQVNAVNEIGAFLDWGLIKDLLVPFREQKVRMVKGRFYTVFLYLDDQTERVVASAKINKFLDNKIPDLKPHDTVSIRIVQRTDLGFKVIVNNLFSGMIYHNEIFSPVNIGEVHPAIVKTIRKDDKIDLIIGKHVKSRVDELAEEIGTILDQQGGTLSLNDSSSPEDIKEVLHCSKKDFKKAVGLLLKSKKIEITDTGIKSI